jgi:hypothetical protein
MDYTQLLSEMPNQEAFKNLTVNHADVGAQHSGSWEASKRFKVLCSDKNTQKQQTEHSSEQELSRVSPREIAATITSRREGKDHLDELESSDGECEIITFMIGATRIHDASKPMPPPSRFVRTGNTTQ